MAGIVGVLVFLYLLMFPGCSYAREPERISYAGPVYEMGEIVEKPPEILEQSGKQYRLVSEGLKTVEREGILTYVSTSIPYELEGKQEPPQTAVVTLKDEISGDSYEREVSLLEVIEKTSEWRTDFSFPITVYQWESDLFLLGDIEIPATADFLDYEEQFLQYLNLPPDDYRIDRIEWNGDVYENEGTACRDAVAYGEKRIRYVEVKYGGQIRTPATVGKRYEAVYEEIILEMETKGRDSVVEKESVAETEEMGSLKIESEAESLMEAKAGIFERISQWLKEHIRIIKFSAVFFVCMIGWILLFFLFQKGKKNGKAGN